MKKYTNITEHNSTETNTYVSDGITWYYDSKDKQEHIVLLSNKATTAYSISIDNSIDFDNTDISLIKENPKRVVFTLITNNKTYFIKIFKSGNISEKAKIAARGNPAEIEAQWLKICKKNNLPVPEVIGYSSGKANILITESLGDVAGFDDIIRQYSDHNPPTLYRKQLPHNLQQALILAGKLVCTMHKAGLILPDLHGGNIMLDKECSKSHLLDLQQMKRCESANDNTIISNPLLENAARLASEIVICCGIAGLELYLEGYLQVINNPIRLDTYIKYIERAVDAWRAKFYAKRDKRCCRQNEYFGEITLGNNFRAKVFLKNNRPMLFSDISKMIFTTNQWQTALEPLKNSRRLFSSKELSLQIGDHNITVAVEGGPTKVIMKKWQYGHSLINRHIATPWPMSFIYNSKQAVLLTEKKDDNICMTYRNILIVKPSALGDVARMLPVLTSLRKKYPLAKISWIIRPEFAELIRHNPALDDVILFDKKQLLKSGVKSIANIKAFATGLKQRKFDLVLDAQGLLRSGLMAWFTKAAVRIGYKRARELAWLFYNTKVDIPTLQHSNLDCWQIGLAAGIENSLPEFGVPVNPSAYTNSRSILEDNGINKSDEFIAFLCGGTAEAKIWPAENFAKLADIIYQKYKMRCILIGTGKREKAIGQIISAAGEKESVVNLIDKSSLAEMVALISDAKLIIGNDSGPLHVAAALPKSVIGIYGPTNPQAVGPYCQNENVVEAGKEIERKGRYSKNQAHKIDNVTIENVMEKVEILIRKKFENEKSK